MVPPLPRDEYLDRVLSRDPATEASAILDLRGRFHGADGGSGASPPPRIPRAEVEEALEAIRESFWTEDAASLRSRLASLGVAGRPDLAAAAERLLILVPHRDGISALGGESWMTEEFLDPWKRALIASPSEAGRIRRSLYDRFVLVRRTRGEGGFVIATLLRKHHPEIHALDREWLGVLEKIPRRQYAYRHAHPRAEEKTSGGADRLGFLVIAWVIIVLASKVLRNC